VLLSWSGGKDSALALAHLREDPRYEVVGLLTTVTADYDRISIHGVRRTLLHCQATELHMPLHEIMIAPQCSNEAYETAWREAFERLPVAMTDARHIAFGDIFLADVRQYREDMAHSLGFETVFPLWGESTTSLAREVLTRQISARLVCVDTDVLPADYVGRSYDVAFLDALPSAIDPCGERGEFHTFVAAGPGFRSAIPYSIGETVLRDERFAFCDLIPVRARVDGLPERLERAAPRPGRA
jgi:uncharacterized protein (TIGR00290 family)